jgi:hypothetical protein
MCVLARDLKYGNRSRLSTSRQNGYTESAMCEALLSAVLGLLGLLGLLSGAFVLFNALDQLTQGEPGVLGNVGLVIIGFILSAFGPIVCGYLAIKCVKAATPK